MRERINLKSVKAWFPVFALTLAAFIFNTPVGGIKLVHI